MEQGRSTLRRRPSPHRRIATAVPVSPAPIPISVVPPPPVAPPALKTDAPVILSKAARHRARWAWEARYLRVLILVDLCVGLFAAVVAFDVRFGDRFTP